MKIIKIFVISIILTLSVSLLFICGAYSQMNGQIIDNGSNKLATAFDNNTELFVLDNEEPIVNIEENNTAENLSQADMPQTEADNTSQNMADDMPSEEDIVADNTEETNTEEAYTE